MDWDKAYDNRAAVPDQEAIFEKWIAKAAQFRQEMTDQSELDISYGRDERERFDLFHPKNQSDGTLIFVHGGYWRSLDKSNFSHIAKSALAHNLTVAMPSYPLVPSVRICDVVNSVTRAINVIAGQTKGPIYLVGHSAGGHLASRSVCADTELNDETVLRLKTVTTISGVHFLTPLMWTQMNSDFRLDGSAAKEASPCFQDPLQVPVNIWVGGRPFYGLETGKNHLNVLDQLEDPKSKMMQSILGVSPN